MERTRSTLGYQVEVTSTHRKVRSLAVSKDVKVYLIVAGVAVLNEVTEVGSESVVLAGTVTTAGVNVVVVTIVLVVMPSRLPQKGATTAFAFTTVTVRPLICRCRAEWMNLAECGD